MRLAARFLSGYARRNASFSLKFAGHGRLQPSQLSIAAPANTLAAVAQVRLAGHFTEDEARYFFQQLIAGVQYCHENGVAHRDLKLENTLLDDSPAPLLKIADFGYSKHIDMHTPPDSTVGTPAYISPVRARAPPHACHGAPWR